MGNFTLKGKDFLKRPLVSCSPLNRAVAKIDKVERNAHLIMVAQNSSLEQVPHAKIPTDCVKVALLTRQVRTRALTPDHFHSSKLRQIAGDLVLHSNGEIGVFASRTKMFEWQNRDRSLQRRHRLCTLIHPGSRANRGDN